MNTITSREMVHNFPLIAARVVAGEELTVTRHGRPLLRLIPVTAAQPDSQQRKALVQRALGVRMARPLGKPFERGDAYEK